MTERPTFDAFKADALEEDYQLKRRMVSLRKAAGLTQAQMAEKLGTKKSSISRLESFNEENSPRLATIEDYARVLGYATRVDFAPLPTATNRGS